MVEVRVEHQLVEQDQLLHGANPHSVLRLVRGISQVTSLCSVSVAVSLNGVAGEGIPNDDHLFAFFLIRHGTFTKKRTFYC